LYRYAPIGLDDAQRLDALAAADTAALMMLTLRTEPDRFGDDSHLGEDGTSDHRASPGGPGQVTARAVILS
jgi:hypothetical protein